MVSMRLEQAVYGPQTNGSTVQLLGQSDGLTQAALAEFSRFYYSAWEISNEERDEFLTFIPLDEQFWGLIRSKVIDERSMGVLFVSHLLAFRQDQLEAIRWRSNRVWDAALEGELVAPPPKTELSVWELDLDDGEDLRAQIEIADRLAYAIESRVSGGQPIRIPELDGAASPKDTLYLAMERLGPMLRARSYCTSALFAASGWKPTSGAIDILASSHSEADASRKLVDFDQTPTEQWIEKRLRDHEIAPVTDLQLDAATLRKLARAELDERSVALLSEHKFEQIGNLARSRRSGRGNYIAPYLLEAVLGRLGDPALAGQALDEFVDDGLDFCPEDPRRQTPRKLVTAAAAETGTIYWANAATIEKLGAEALFGVGQSLDDGVREDLEKSLTSAISHEKIGATKEAVTKLLALMPDDAVFDSLRVKLLALSAAYPDRALAKVEEYLSSGDSSLSQFLQRANDLASYLPETMVAAGNRHLGNLCAGRALTALNYPTSVEEGMEALIFAFRQSEIESGASL